MLKPQILAAMMLVGIMGVLVILFQPEFIAEIAGGAITAIGMLGMKLLEKE